MTHTDGCSLHYYTCSEGPRGSLNTCQPHQTARTRTPQHTAPVPTVLRRIEAKEKNVSRMRMSV
ncbi:hypothetical protein E2C01_065782 [Portunus trituberculatus]|uniref:Uncharacterized protein n=1 Tax=Portunus trituberculatus TaxID=210409 RepID=A0A5B7HPC7_PORTR|nr:hypothetical protein [Portunus trituberculatus]